MRERGSLKKRPYEKSLHALFTPSRSSVLGHMLGKEALCSRKLCLHFHQNIHDERIDAIGVRSGETFFSPLVLGCMWKFLPIVWPGGVPVDSRKQITGTHHWSTTTNANHVLWLDTSVTDITLIETDDCFFLLHGSSALVCTHDICSVLHVRLQLACRLESLGPAPTSVHREENDSIREARVCVVLVAILIPAWAVTTFHHSSFSFWFLKQPSKSID